MEDGSVGGDSGATIKHLPGEPLSEETAIPEVTPTPEEDDDEDKPTFDESYVTKTYHHISMSIYVRSLEAATAEYLDSLEAKLQSIVKNHNFSSGEHVRIEHDEKECPKEGEDLFELKEAQSYAVALGMERPAEEEIMAGGDDEPDFYDVGGAEDADGFGTAAEQSKDEGTSDGSK